MGRKIVGKKTQADILADSRRRCCICFGLNRDFEVKRGQIAHLDGDSSNNDYDNLAFLCLEHHDMYDSKTSQSKNFTMEEAKRYRRELYEQVIPLIQESSSLSIASNRHVPEKHFEKYQEEERKKAILENFPKYGVMLSIKQLPSKLGISKQLVENLLFQLSKENVVRIDRRPGSTKKTYSLKNCVDNRLIDTFLETIDEEIVSDYRHISKRGSYIDAIIETSKSVFVVATIFEEVRLTNEIINMSLLKLVKARQTLRIENATNVLLIGITSATTKEDVDLKQVEKKSILVRYIDLENNSALP